LVKEDLAHGFGLLRAHSFSSFYGSPPLPWVTIFVTPRKWCSAS
jgi:hypothetical protein